VCPRVGRAFALYGLREVVKGEFFAEGGKKPITRYGLYLVGGSNFSATTIPKDG